MTQHCAEAPDLCTDDKGCRDSALLGNQHGEGLSTVQGASTVHGVQYSARTPALCRDDIGCRDSRRVNGR